MLKNTQLVSEEISEDMASAKEELDEAVPIHTLLDVSANRSKAELAHKCLLSQRQRPSTEALRATVLRKSVSTLSSASDSGFPVRIYFCRFSGRLGRQGVREVEEVREVQEVREVRVFRKVREGWEIRKAELACPQGPPVTAPKALNRGTAS